MDNIIASIVGGLLVLLIQYIFKEIKETRSDFTGNWENNILDEKQNVIKVDELRVQQNNDRLYGSIQRVEPSSQAYRKWFFEGRMIGNNFIAIFWPKDKTVISYGSWYVHQVGDSKFEGFYLKLNEKDGKIDKIPLELTKVN